MSAGRPPSRPKILKSKFVRAAGYALLGLSLISCGGISEEQRIIDRFRHMADLAEDEDTAGIMAALSQGYEDFEGRNKVATEEMLRGHFQAYRGIVINVLGARVTDLQAEEASLEADIMFSSGAAQALRRLIRLAGEYYRIEVRWVKERAVWMAANAEWRSVGLDDLFPESRHKLSEILPK